ncbi:MAG TPA: low affinity iron permease family protein [Chthoniobacteraceae bacterium]|nr:low affinity iron permease family protein [Chthoniobacteraceae bacterium]
MSRPNDRPPSEKKSLIDHFAAFARWASNLVGSVWAFFLALLVVVVWLATGPMFGFSDTWQLVINTGTTIVTFIMVFLIQSTQNRDAKAVHLKLDEVIRAIHGARNSLVDLEDLPDDELERVAKEFAELHRRACATAAARGGHAKRPNHRPAAKDRSET